MSVLPAKKLLADTVLLVLKDSPDPLKASAINDAVAKILQIPESILQIEDANCSGTEFSYQMRWVRTDLKNKGLIINPSRGFWAIAK